jgi:hypothetical protein
VSYCIGTGRPEDADHCCYIDGNRCPHLLDIDQARQWRDTIASDRRELIDNQIDGMRWLCRIALKVLADNPELRSDRAKFDAAWDADPEYVATPGSQWRQLETRLGLDSGSLQCSTWRGDGDSCCFARSHAEADALASSLHLHVDAVTLRRAGGR